MRRLLLFVAMVGCYSANPEVGIPCSGEDFACPHGQSCDFNRQPPTCVKVLLDAAIDAALACNPANNTCPMDSPTCDSSTLTCRRCVADSDCPSNVCRESAGTCVTDVSTVIWVKIGGDDAGMCTEAMPCGTIGRGLEVVDAARNFIRIDEGMYQQQLTSTKPVTMSGTSRATAARITENPGALGPTLNASAELTIEAVQFVNSPNNAININNAKLTVFGATFEGNGGQAVDGNAAKIDVRQSSFINNNRGLDLQTNSDLVVSRTLFRNQRDWAIRANSSKYDVTNSLFVDNARGMSIENMFIAGSRLEHSTFVGTKNDRSVRCNNMGPVVGNSIFAGSMTALVIDTKCTARYVIVDNQLVPGMNNMMVDPGFVSPTDFHLAPGSKAVDAADPASTELIDFDGLTRPRGVRRDIGAYEQ